MRFHNIVFAIFSSIALQGNVASAIPLDSSHFTSQTVRGEKATTNLVERVVLDSDAVKGVSTIHEPGGVGLTKRKGGSKGGGGASCGNLSTGQCFGYVVLGLVGIVVVASVGAVSVCMLQHYKEKYQEWKSARSQAMRLEDIEGHAISLVNEHREGLDPVPQNPEGARKVLNALEQWVEENPNPPPYEGCPLDDSNGGNVQRPEKAHVSGKE